MGFACAQFFSCAYECLLSGISNVCSICNVNRDESRAREQSTQFYNVTESLHTIETTGGCDELHTFSFWDVKIYGDIWPQILMYNCMSVGYCGCEIIWSCFDGPWCFKGTANSTSILYMQKPFVVWHVIC